MNKVRSIALSSMLALAVLGASAYAETANIGVYSIAPNATNITLNHSDDIFTEGNPVCTIDQEKGSCHNTAMNIGKAWDFWQISSATYSGLKYINVSRATDSCYLSNSISGNWASVTVESAQPYEEMGQHRLKITYTIERNPAEHRDNCHGESHLLEEIVKK